MSYVSWFISMTIFFRFFAVEALSGTCKQLIYNFDNKTFPSK